MTNKRVIPTVQLIFAGAATVATFALFNLAQPATAIAAPATGAGTGASSKVINVDDNNNPSSGDIFTQNAQDQSTANGAGT
jgi:hypothetical protein